MKLSRSFDLEEFLVSQEATRKGIDNQPTAEHLINLQLLAQNTMQPIRDLMQKPVVISSGYRSEALNRAVGGAKNSQHTRGEACDFIVPGVPVKVLCGMIIGSGIEFDQLICEFNKWVHISYSKVKNRKEILTAVKGSDGKTQYLSGIV